MPKYRVTRTRTDVAIVHADDEPDAVAEAERIDRWEHRGETCVIEHECLTNPGEWCMSPYEPHWSAKDTEASPKETREQSWRRATADIVTGKTHRPGEVP